MHLENALEVVRCAPSDKRSGQATAGRERLEHEVMMNRASIVLALALAVMCLQGPRAAEVFGQARGGQAALPKVIAYKDPSCGCCTLWVQHMKRAGFIVTVVNTPDMAAVRREYGVPVAQQSCHTAIVDGFVVEGHVPADDVKRLLQERPKVVGLAVPGMPLGSPGMEQGDSRQPYKVLTFDTGGKTAVFSQR
jgi:hypothetical protein